MVDKETQFDSQYKHYFERLFDDIFCINEEQILPLSSIGGNLRTKEKKELQKKLVNQKKGTFTKEARNALKSQRTLSERETKIIIAKAVFEKLESQKTEEDRKAESQMDQESLMKRQEEMRMKNAFAPIPIIIPNLALHEFMPHWSLGGPTSNQYHLLCHLLQMSREEAKLWFYEMIASYLGLRQNAVKSPKLSRELDEILSNNKFERWEEKLFFLMFFPEDVKQPSPPPLPVVDGQSIGSVFLKLRFHTDHNEVFKVFVKKVFTTMTAEVRETLAGRFLVKRMADLCGQYYVEKKHRINYIRVIWDMKLKHMDDYTVCLILFIRDKTANISWDEIEDILVADGHPIIQRMLNNAVNNQ